MNDLQRTILNAALPRVVFDGWTMATLEAAAVSCGLHALDAKRAFSEGVMQAIECWTRDANVQMKDTLARDYHLDSMKIRERIATCVMVRLRQHNPHREAARRAAALLAMPWNIGLSSKLLYDTVDTMWRAAGDTATDFNFYSKRGLLAKVYLSTFVIWLNDDSENLVDTEAFLKRRIDDVMQIQKFKSKVSGWMKSESPVASH